MKRAIQKLTVAGLVKFLTVDAGTQSRFITVTAVTPVTDIKKKNPFGEVFKRAIVNGWVNFSFKKAVEKNVAKKLGIDASEVEYTLGTSWHVPMMNEDGKPTCVHINKNPNEKFYLFYRHNKTLFSEYFDKTGKPIAYDDLKPWLYAKKESEFKPIVNCLTLNNVIEMNAMKQTLVVV